MNYESFKERYNEVMYDERDVIQKFLETQMDIRYGHQRDTWHIEPSVNLMSTYGAEVGVTDIRLDKDKVVLFTGVCCSEKSDFECADFAYGELGKIIERLPNPAEIVRCEAIADLRIIMRDYNVKNLLKEHPFEIPVGEDSIKFNDYDIVDGDVVLIKDENRMTDAHLNWVTKLRDHMNVTILHGYKEYKDLVKLLSLQPNLRFEPHLWGDVEFTIHGTDMKVDVLSASLDSNGNLQICVDDDNKEAIYLEEKDIRPEYLVDLVGYMEDHLYYDIMDTYNGHNEELVRKINAAWKEKKYHDMFSEILLALLVRDHEEYLEKYQEIDDYSGDWAMSHAHEIMEGVCDDMDLETILSFIRYEE